MSHSVKVIQFSTVLRYFSTFTDFDVLTEMFMCTVTDIGQDGLKEN